MTSPEGALRALALVDRSRGAPQITLATQGVRESFQALGRDATVTDSADWYKSFFPRCGDWDSWIWETVAGKDYATRKQRFAVFVVCDTPLGKANAGIVRLALRTGTPVLRWEDGAPLTLVVELVEADRQDWGAQWDVRTAPLGG
jgi:hypothetical protein